ncbi:multidrug effflux MFS transporter [Mycobacterium sp. KBS0706]|nr:multidrug effflux MFS transporter [Mycobacterium sp. KBS0706]
MRLRHDSPMFTLLLGGFAALPSWAIDAALPAFPTIGRDLAASPSQIGFTIAAFMAGLAVGQLVFGPLSDQLGRRPSLLAGIGLFVLSALACMLAPSVAALIIWRLFAGIGAAAGAAIAFAIIRDLFDGARARTKLAFVNLLFGVIPLVAPTLGSWILASFGWRWIFGALVIVGSALALITWLCLDESKAPRRASDRVGIVELYVPVLANRAFVARVLVDSLSFGAMFTFVAGSSLILMTGFDVGPSTFSLLFACAAFGGMIGAWINGPLGRSGVGAGAILDLGLSLSAANAVLLVVLSIAGLAGVATMMPSLVLALFCRGLVMPSIVQAALEPMDGRAGAASGVLGCLEIVAGTAASALVSLLFGYLGTASMPLAMALFAVLALALWGFLVRPTFRQSGFVRAGPPESQ